MHFLIFHYTQLLAPRARDWIIREECTKAQGINDLKEAMNDLRTLFEKCKSFLSKEPGQDAYDGATLTFGDNPFENTLDNGSLQEILEQVGDHNPRLLLHVRSAVGDLQEEQPFADLMESLLDESVRVSELNVAREEKTKERKIKAKALARDAEIIKQELQGFNDNSWSISIV